MVTQYEAFVESRLPDDMSLEKTAEYPCTTGRVAKVWSLKAAGLFRLLSAAKRVGITSLPPDVSPLDVLTPDQRDELRSVTSHEDLHQRLSVMLATLSDEQRERMEQAKLARVETMLQWLCECETLAPALVAATSDVTEAEFKAMEAGDAAGLLGVAIETTDWGTTAKLIRSFMNRAAGAVTAANRRSVTSQAVAGSAT